MVVLTPQWIMTLILLLADHMIPQGMGWEARQAHGFSDLGADAWG
jgi:hypothetical protein